MANRIIRTLLFGRREGNARQTLVMPCPCSCSRYACTCLLSPFLALLLRGLPLAKGLFLATLVVVRKDKPQRQRRCALALVSRSLLVDLVMTPPCRCSLSPLSIRLTPSQPTYTSSQTRRAASDQPASPSLYTARRRVRRQKSNNRVPASACTSS